MVRLYIPPPSSTHRHSGGGGFYFCCTRLAGPDVSEELKLVSGRSPPDDDAPNANDPVCRDLLPIRLCHLHAMHHGQLHSLELSVRSSLSEESVVHTVERCTTLHEQHCRQHLGAACLWPHQWQAPAACMWASGCCCLQYMAACPACKPCLAKFAVARKPAITSAEGRSTDVHHTGAFCCFHLRPKLPAKACSGMRVEGPQCAALAAAPLPHIHAMGIQGSWWLHLRHISQVATVLAAEPVLLDAVSSMHDAATWHRVQASGAWVMSSSFVQASGSRLKRDMRMRALIYNCTGAWADSRRPSTRQQQLAGM
jgi:hypothetical protein